MTNVIMAGTGSDAFVELAGGRPGLRNRTQGRLFRKQILHLGEFQHPKVPGKKIRVDEAFADTLVRNFQAGLSVVQAPVVNDKNQHTEDPDRNVGEVIDLDYDEKGVYAYLDARDEKRANALGKTLIGASAMMNLDYENSMTGEHVGPTLLHMAITNRPYITNLAPFEEVVGLSADTSDEETVLLGAVEHSEEDDMPKTREELIEALKVEHGIDVDALLEAVDPDASAELAALSNVLGDKADLTITDVAEAVLELSQTNADLREQVTTLETESEANRLTRATEEVDRLVGEGRILPKQRDRMIQLSMKDRETFDDLVPDEAIVSLSEEGVTTHEVTNGADSEVERYLASISGKSTE